MGKVISISNRREIQQFNNKLVTQPETAVGYLFLCKENLTIEDYEELLLSIMDEDYYEKADIQIQAIVNEYFRFDK